MNGNLTYNKVLNNKLEEKINKEIKNKDQINLNTKKQNKKFDPEKFDPSEDNLILRIFNSDEIKNLDFYKKENLESFIKKLNSFSDVSETNILNKTYHIFDENGFSVAYLLSESHAGIHISKNYNKIYETPKGNIKLIENYTSFEISSCGNTKPYRSLTFILGLLKPDYLEFNYVVPLRIIKDNQRSKEIDDFFKELKKNYKTKNKNNYRIEIIKTKTMNSVVYSGIIEYITENNID